MGQQKMQNLPALAQCRTNVMGQRWADEQTLGWPIQYLQPWANRAASDGPMEGQCIRAIWVNDLLNIDNPYFEGMVNQIYPPELQLNKANISDTEAPFLDLHLSVANGFVSSRINDNRNDFDFDIVNFPCLDDDVPRRASYGVYISATY